MGEEVYIQIGFLFSQFLPIDIENRLFIEYKFSPVQHRIGIKIFRISLFLLSLPDLCSINFSILRKIISVLLQIVIGCSFRDRGVLLNCFVLIFGQDFA